jgi:predicted RNA-binding Zn-ribbon protein involved in translation (DUF1610 family)
MGEPRQRPIPITGKERAALEEQKRRYEQSTGDKGDWGKFLGTIALLGLAAAGIYALAKATSRTKQSVNVECSSCGNTFIMAVSEKADPAIYTTCPHCGEDLVVYLRKSTDTWQKVG